MKTDPRSLRQRKVLAAFTLVEMLVSFTVLALLLIVLFSMTDITFRMWKDTTEKIQAFDAARTAFDRMALKIGQSTLNTYWDYDNPSAPTRYDRKSELQFLSMPTSTLGGAFTAASFPVHSVFFQAPTGVVASKSSYGNMPLLLNAYGYFVEYGSDGADRPSFLPPSIVIKYRYRLKEWCAPAEKFKLYGKTSGVGGGGYLGAQTLNWMTLFDPRSRSLAENVIALIVNPINTDTPTGTGVPLTADFIYNSRNSGVTPLETAQRHQLPPRVELIMVALDEASADRQFKNSPVPPSLGVGLFTDPANLETDLEALSRELTQKKLKFIVLRSTVQIRGARWSQ